MNKYVDSYLTEGRLALQNIRLNGGTLALTIAVAIVAVWVTRAFWNWDLRG